MKYLKRQSCIITVLLLLVFVIGSCTTFSSVSAQTKNIKNDIFWNTKDGRPINSQGGGIFRFPDPATGVIKYFWYGVHYVEADSYRKDPSVTQPTSTFAAVTCYSSTDLVSWKFEGNVLTKDSVNKNGKTWVGRLGVAYIKDLNKYGADDRHQQHGRSDGFHR